MPTSQRKQNSVSKKSSKKDQSPEETFAGIERSTSPRILESWCPQFQEKYFEIEVDSKLQKDQWGFKSSKDWETEIKKALEAPLRPQEFLMRRDDYEELLKYHESLKFQKAVRPVEKIDITFSVEKEHKSTGNLKRSKALWGFD